MDGSGLWIKTDNTAYQALVLVWLWSGKKEEEKNLLVMPKYWGKQIITHGSFPEVGQKQKTEKKEREKEERKLVITMAS